MLMLGALNSAVQEWQIPVLGTSAVSGEGIPELVGAIRRHREVVPPSAAAARARRIAAFRLEKTAENLLLERFRARLKTHEADQIESLATRGIDPYSTAIDLLNLTLHGDQTHEPLA
jgi:LAO/AO transport system kinase